MYRKSELTATEASSSRRANALHPLALNSAPGILSTYVVAQSAERAFFESRCIVHKGFFFVTPMACQEVTTWKDSGIPKKRYTESISTTEQARNTAFFMKMFALVRDLAMLTSAMFASAKRAARGPLRPPHTLAISPSLATVETVATISYRHVQRTMTRTRCLFFPTV